MNRLYRILRRPLGPIDRLLDHLTSYRLVLYVLYAIFGWSLLASLFNQVPFKWYQIASSAGWLIVVCWVINTGISKFLNVPKNKGSEQITALILSLILSPASDLKGYLILAAAGTVAMLSKYILVIGKRHIFNPAAAGAFVAGNVLHHYASWWVGNKVLTPLVLIGGFLILRKMKRFSLAGLFIAIYFVILAINVAQSQFGGSVVHVLWLALIASPLLFFAYVMLPEPLTSPSTKSKFLPYTALVAVLYGVSSLRLSPEQSLLVGNVFAFLVEPSKRLMLTFKRKIKEADGIYSFIFGHSGHFAFTAGQYMEWTLPIADSDSRGNRRYFTISSSPTEKDLMITTRLPVPASSFKTKLDNFMPGDEMLASHLSGSFTLPKDNHQKLAFLAGGVGITPFRSIAKDLLDKKTSRNIILLYSANSKHEFAFSDLFKRAGAVGLKTTYVQGHIDKKAITTAIADYKQRRFYISGPYSFVNGMREVLLGLGMSEREIVVDYFPGYG